MPADEARVSDEAFVCVECLLKMQEMASRGRESLWVHTPLVPGGRLVTAGDTALFLGGTGFAAGALVLVLTGRLFLLALADGLAGLANALKNCASESLKMAKTLPNWPKNSATTRAAVHKAETWVFKNAEPL